MKKEFLIAFRISRMVIFEVNYYTSSDNSPPFFSTEEYKFNRPKTDWARSGQCQEALLTGKAFRFWCKWDNKHLHDLTKEEYKEMISDLEDLKRTYLYEEKVLDESQTSNFQFYKLKELSMKK